MAGHSQFKNIMHRKGAQGCKTGKDVCPRSPMKLLCQQNQGYLTPTQTLVYVPLLPRAANMPRDNIDRAMKKALKLKIQQTLKKYVMKVMVQAVPLSLLSFDRQRNRTASEVRGSFLKTRWSLGETGACYGFHVRPYMG